MPKYLKDHVKAAGGTLLLQIDSVGSPFTNDREKEVRHTSFRIKSTGAILTEDIMNVKFVKYGLKGAKAGDHVEAFLTPEGWADYKLVEANAESSAPLSQSSHQQIQSERKATASIEQYDQDKKQEAASKILFGYMIEGYKLGKDPQDAASDAVLFYKAQMNAVERALAPDVPAPDSEYQNY